ncbi:hypothetical protein BCR35DRAFT_309819 [Leucosporidium creatinivorum]|uniref:3'-5' exonuclease domain-containing protein n=1 Tax=Leucosporidium creatinivorum TaxID=106004 RepID=A0A1Y2DBB9_9BASI|nr:hypothetical protein BCR35DRAFT_309819 [Leucosporidium creatinivorum]
MLPSTAAAARGLALNALRLASSSSSSLIPLTSSSAFSTTAINLAARPARVKAARAEVFNHRRLDPSLPIAKVPQVDYTRDLSEAEELLDSLRASRFSLQVANKTTESHQRDGGTIMTEGDVAVLAIADMEGVVVLHLSHMKRIPSRLRAILEDPKIVKQTFGAISYVQDFDKDPKLWDGVQCTSMLDLRELGPIFPRLREPDTESMSHSGIRRAASLHLFGLGHATPGTGHNFDVSKLGATSLDYIVNAAWLTQQLGIKFDERLDEIEAEAAKKVGMTAAAEVVEALLERATYSTVEYRALKIRYG